MAVLLAALPFAGTRAISAASVCVNPYGTHGCFPTINAAIAAAAPGDVIRIAAGRYIENVIVDKSVTLAGVGNVVIMPAFSNPVCGPGSLCGGAASNIVLVRADNVTIHDLTLDGDNPHLTSGIVKDHADLDARNGIITDHELMIAFNNLTVYNINVRNIYLRGIYASSGGTFNFHDNCVSNVQGDLSSVGMFNFGGSGRMVRNNVSKANDAISSNHSRGVQFLDNEVTRSGSGVHTDNAGDGGGTGDVIRGNRVSDGMPGAYGIFVFVPYVPVTVVNNDVSGVDVGLAAFGGPFTPPLTATSLLTDNDVKGRNTAGSVGVLVTTDQVGFGQGNVAAVLTRNSVSNFETGVNIQAKTGQSAVVNATCNAIVRSSSRGMVAGGLAPGPDYPGLPSAFAGDLTVTFTQSNINGKTVGMENFSAPATINATRNWWGCQTGPNTPGCDSVTGVSNLFPYLTRPAACAPDGSGKGKGK